MFRGTTIEALVDTDASSTICTVEEPYIRRPEPWSHSLAKKLDLIIRKPAVEEVKSITKIFGK